MIHLLLFLTGFLIGYTIVKHGDEILTLIIKVYYDLYAILYYRPKVKYYTRFLKKRGWNMVGYDEFLEWEHPQKGKAYFYTAVCKEKGKKIRL